MASSNARRRQVARAKYERQQLRRSTRERRRRRLRRVALVLAIVVLVALIVLGIYLIFFAGGTTPTAQATPAVRAFTPAPDRGSIW
jgi:peptidyl-prolyl cis-trans isomerase B (cyclophilin B)